MKKVYLVYKRGYIEDYILIQASTEEEIMKEYCRLWNKEEMDLDDFFENHIADEINCIGDRRIKKIIFEEE